MKSQIIFEEFKSICINYELDLNDIVIKNAGNIFKLHFPNDPNNLFYTCFYKNSRLQGSVNNFEDLVEEAKDVVGSETFNLKDEEFDFEKSRFGRWS